MPFGYENSLKKMVVENTESTESAITFTAHSTDSGNTVLLSKKEHYTHGTLCSFPSVDIWVIALLQPVWILVN